MPSRRFALALVLLVSAAPAVAAANAAPPVEIERMTWPEVRDRLAAGADTVIIPTGGTESNGAHMVTGKHNFIVAEAARRIAAGLGNALVAPVIAYVPEGDIATRSGHMAYPGTFSVPDDVFAGLLEAAAASAKAHGARTIVFLGDSGGNQTPQQALAERLSARWRGDGVVVINADAYYAETEGRRWLEGDGETAHSIAAHAGVRDTSELMAAHYAGVHLDRVETSGEAAVSGAARASEARGEQLLALKVAAAIAEIRAAQARAGEHAAVRSGFFAWLYQLIFG